MYSKEELMKIVRDRSLKIAPEGEVFTLASGKKSTYYCDGKMTTLDSRGAVLIGEGILELLEADKAQGAGFPDAVGGMSIGADPICAAVITIAGTRRRRPESVPRQESDEGPWDAEVYRSYGQGGRPRDRRRGRVTTGAARWAIERLEEAGIKVDGVIAILDRMEGAPSVCRPRLFVPVAPQNYRFRNRTAQRLIARKLGAMNLSKFDLNLSPFGVRVRIMPTFWLVCALFSPFFTEFKGPWVVGLLSWTAGLLLAFLAHHLTQAALMRRLYGETPQIELGFGRSTSGELVFGGLTSCAKLEEASMKRALIAASGPVVGIALSVLAAKLLELAGLPFYTLPVFGSSRS